MLRILLCNSALQVQQQPEMTTSAWNTCYKARRTKPVLPCEDSSRACSVQTERSAAGSRDKACRLETLLKQKAATQSRANHALSQALPNSSKRSCCTIWDQQQHCHQRCTHIDLCSLALGACCCCLLLRGRAVCAAPHRQLERILQGAAQRHTTAVRDNRICSHNLTCWDPQLASKLPNATKSCRGSADHTLSLSVRCMADPSSFAII